MKEEYRSQESEVRKLIVPGSWFLVPGSWFKQSTKHKAQRTVFYLLSFCLFLLSACGYHVAGNKGSIPGDLKSISVPFFSNKTAEPEIESILTSPFVEELVNIGLIRVVENGEGILKGTIKRYTLTPISFYQNDVVSEYRVTVVLDLILVRVSDEKILWEGRSIKDSEEFTANRDIVVSETNEKEAIKKIAIDLARSFKESILEEF